MIQKTSKNTRILDIYVRLCEGKPICKSEEATRFGVDERTIQRDIEDVRIFLDERKVAGSDNRTIEYNRVKKCFEIQGSEGSMMSNAEILATSKILLESRAFTKKEISAILDKMIIGCVPKKYVKLVSDLINNEKFHYTELKNKKPLKDIIWDIGTYIKEQRIIEITYNKQSSVDNQVKRIVEPLSIMFSEYYFYLLANPLTKTENGYEKQFDNPTIYRFDRIVKCKPTNDKFCIDYSNRFEEGVFRKQIQFMYAGELEHIQFRYTGINVEAILDRLPTANVVSSDENGYIVEASAYGKGLMMWLLSHGDNVEVLRPERYREQMRQMLESMTRKYLC